MRPFLLNCACARSLPFEMSGDVTVESRKFSGSPHVFRKSSCFFPVCNGAMVRYMCWLQEKMASNIDTCKFYNTSSGCQRGSNCRYLHVCRYFLLDECKFGPSCKRNHDLSKPEVKRKSTYSILYDLYSNRTCSMSHRIETSSVD